jgi:hypothetical protein
MKEHAIEKAKNELYNIYKSYENLVIKNGSYSGRFQAKYTLNNKIVKFDIICKFDELENMITHTIRFYFNENEFEDIVNAISILENKTAKIINNTIQEILSFNNSKLISVSVDMDIDNRIRIIFIDGDFLDKPDKKRWNTLFHGEKNIFLDDEEEQEYIVLRHLMTHNEFFEEYITSSIGDISGHNEKNRDEIKKYIAEYKENKDGFLIVTDMVKI